MVHDSQHAHSHQIEDNKNTEFSALEAQFFEYNQISDSFGSFGSYDLLQHQPNNEFGLSLDLMNLPPPAYHMSNGGDMDTSPLYTPMEAMSINPSMTMSSGAPQVVNPHSLQHAQGVPLPPSPTGSTSALHHHHQNMHQNMHHGYSQSQTMHSPMMTSPHMLASGTEFSAGALSSASSTGGSPISHRDGAPLPDAPSPSPSMSQKEPSHGRAGSNASDKNQMRYNPIKVTRGSPAAPSAASTTPGPRTRRRAGTTGSVKKEKEEMRAAAAAVAKEEDHDSDDDDLDYPAPSAGKSDKREEIRKQRIESEQRRRDELREGYRRLKEALPSSNQKSSKVALLDRAVNHIRYMEMTRTQLQVRLNAAEMEMARLRQVNEALMLGTAEQRAAAAAASAAVQAHVQPQY